MKISFYRTRISEWWFLGPAIGWGELSVVTIGLCLGWWEVGIKITGI
jgi:hypothetical protein